MSASGKHFGTESERGKINGTSRSTGTDDRAGDAENADDAEYDDGAGFTGLSGLAGPTGVGRTTGPTGRRVGSAGRMLDRSRDGAILAAALEVLAEVGYDRLTMDLVAARARAGKGALYRRWPSKAGLVVDAIADWHRRQAPASFPDTGSLRGDLEAIAAAMPESGDVSGREYVSLVAGLSTAAARDPELGALLSEQVLGRPRRALRELLQRAVARGEIAPDRDLTLVPDVMMGLNLLRMVAGKAVDREYLRTVFDEVLLPLVTSDKPREEEA